MNTTTTTTAKINTRLALGTAIAALCFGAAACGSETSDDPTTPNKEAGSLQQSRMSPRAAQRGARARGTGPAGARGARRRQALGPRSRDVQHAERDPARVAEVPRPAPVRHAGA